MQNNCCICSFRPEQIHSQEHLSTMQSQQYTLQSQKTQHVPVANNNGNQEKMLSVSGKKKCSHCGEELGNRASSKNFFYHIILNIINILT